MLLICFSYASHMLLIISHTCCHCLSRLEGTSLNLLSNPTSFKACWKELPERSGLQTDLKHRVTPEEKLVVRREHRRKRLKRCSESRKIELSPGCGCGCAL